MSDRPRPPAAVVIVGGGFSGASAAVQLVRRSARPLAITIVEPRPAVGPGLAYSTTDPDHRLNGPVLTHGIDPEDPADLLHWCERQGLMHSDPGMFSSTGKPFVRRADFGRYLADAVQAHAHWPATGSTLAHVRSQAVAATRAAGGWTVALQDGAAVHGALLIVATGNPRPRLRPPFDAALARHPQVWADPLNPARPPRVAPDARVLVVGSGLTALDLVATLLRQGHRGPVEVVSRRGLRPREQAPDPATPPGPPWPRVLDLIHADMPGWLQDAQPRSARGWTRALRRRIAEGLARGETWHAGFDELRNTVWRSWPLLPPAEQRRVQQRLRAWYDMHRFRTPPMTDARVRAAEARGQVLYRAARVGRVWAQPDNTLQATWTPPSGGSGVTQTFDAAFNCTGLDAAARVDDNPLLASLQAQGRLCIDAAGIGFAVDAQGRAIDTHGDADPTLHLVGPPTAGTFGDPLGVLFIAAQVHRMVPHWLAALPSPD